MCGHAGTEPRDVSAAEILTALPRPALPARAVRRSRRHRGREDTAGSLLRLEALRRSREEAQNKPVMPQLLEGNTARVFLKE